MKKALAITTLLTSLFFWSIAPAYGQTQSNPLPSLTVTNVLVVPKDQQLDPEYPQLIANTVRLVQAKYQEILGGQTFNINQDSNPIVIHSNKTLSELCKQKNPCEPSLLLSQLVDTGLPITDISRTWEDGSVGEAVEIREPVILNIYVVGWTHPAAAGIGWWYRHYQSGWTVMGDYALAAMKGGPFNRNHELLCQTILGRSCSSQDALHLTAHELGHAFGLSMGSRWSNGHPCTTAKVDECRPDLDPKYRPDPIEWTYSLMGYGSIPFTNLGLNDSCVNPEKTLLKNSRYFGGAGFDHLNFENCLKLPSTSTIKITGIEKGTRIAIEDEITIQTEGLLPDDANLKVVFPGDNPSQRVEKLDEGKLLVTVPTTFSGEMVISVMRNGEEIRSNPYPITVVSHAPFIQKVEPAAARAGDTVTILGDYFVDDRPNIQSSVPMIRLGSTQISNILEYSKTHIKFQIPTNTTVGITPVMVEVGTLNTKTQKSLLWRSNGVDIKILGSSVLEGKLERAITASAAFKEVAPGELVNFTASVLEKNSTPQTAEIWVINQSGETGCDGKLQGRWCQAGQLSLPSSSIPGRQYSFTGSYVPKSPGVYVAVVNILGSNDLKCSGDPNRPTDWLDCGENSRLYFTVSKEEVSKQATITAHYQIINNSGVMAHISPTLCEYIQGGKSCVGIGTFTVKEGEDVSFDYSFHTSPRGQLKARVLYEIGCAISPPELNQGCEWQSAKPGDKLMFKVVLGKVTVQPVEPSPPSKSAQPICSLTASPVSVKVGESITWTITAEPKGARAYWRGTNNGVSIVPIQVERYPTASSWQESYQYSQPGSYVRYVGIEDETGKTICTTEQRAVLVQDTSKKIVKVTLTSTGQVHDLIGTGQTVIRLPGTIGLAQTFDLLITIEYSDATRSYKNLSFRYNPPQTTSTPFRTVCPGECGDANGRTAGGTVCSGWIEGNKWSNCPDTQYPYCFTCPETGQGSSSPPSNITPPSPPSLAPTPSSTICNGVVYSCTGLSCTDGSTPPGTGCYETGGDLNNRWRIECLASCPTPSSSITQSQVPVASTSCTGSGEVCADSEGKPMDGSAQKCKAYLNDATKDKSCADQYWYCWKDCY